VHPGRLFPAADEDWARDASGHRAIIERHVERSAGPA
jgi:hypothetical protein